jgi:6-pyruvoyltetrahydropterin/6-carboxytetrahydropterin synthase
MYRLKVITSFAAAHNLNNYQGECENLHGHNWRVEVSVTASELDKAGLCIDFKILKSEAKELLGRLDHKYLNELECFAGDSPSSENISKFIFTELSKKINNDNVKVEMITVWESDFACASYYEG